MDVTKVLECPVKESFKLPRGRIGPGACDMPLYARLVDRVVLVRTADQLARVAESLIEEGAHAHP